LLGAIYICIYTNFCTLSSSSSIYPGTPVCGETKIASIRKSSFMVLSADTYARAAVRHIGYEQRCTPYWPHSVMWFLISILPESFINSFRLAMCIKIHKKGLAKDAKKKSLRCFRYLLSACRDSHCFFITSLHLATIAPESFKNENIVVPYTIVKRKHVVLLKAKECNTM
jgi:hypothetical protein